MNNEKDLFIKSKLKNDELISKKADDVFNSFFKEEMKVEEEKVVNINSSKDKKSNKRKILATVATLLVIFLSANTYAATQGYNNIFFIIKNLVTNGEVTNKEDILSDRDITISYQYIDIAEGFKIQIQKLIVKDNKAKLYLRINEEVNIPIVPEKYLVYDTTSNDKKLIGEAVRSKDEISNVEHQYEKIIDLENISADTEKLQLEIQDKDSANIITIEININQKEIDIINGSVQELEKISEVELKEILSKYAIFNFYNDNNDFVNEEVANECKNYALLNIAKDLIMKKENNSVLEKEKVHYVIQEICGENYTDPIESSMGGIYFDYETQRYEQYEGDSSIQALCLDITDISYINGVYTVTFIYCYPTANDYIDNNIENLAQYTTTMKLKLNSDYKYTKYCIIGLDDLKSEILTDNIIEEENYFNNIEDIEVESNYDTIEDVSNVDNYASTMEWTEYWTPGMNIIYPSEWTLEEFGYDMRGNNPGATATVISGLARGIDKETNTIIDSNMIISFYEPNFVEFNSEEEFYDYYANEYNDGYALCGYETDTSGKWHEIYWEDASSIEGESTSSYFHYEPLSEGGGIEYRIDIYSTNSYNYKVVNIINWLMGNITLTSY